MDFDEFYGLVEDEVVNRAIEYLDGQPTDAEIVDIMYDVLDEYLNTPDYAEELLSYFKSTHPQSDFEEAYENSSNTVDVESPTSMVYAFLEQFYIENMENDCINAVNEVLENN